MNDPHLLSHPDALHALLQNLEDLGLPHDRATAAGILTRLAPEHQTRSAIEDLAIETAFALVREYPGGGTSPDIAIDRELWQDTKDCLLVAAQARLVAGKGLNVAYAALDAFIEIDLAEAGTGHADRVHAPVAVCARAARILASTHELQKTEILPAAEDHMYAYETPLWWRLPHTALHLETECAVAGPKGGQPDPHP